MRSPFASHRCVTLITRQTDEDSLPLPPGDQGGFLKMRLKQQVLAQVLQACKWQCPGGSFFLTAALEKTGGPGFSLRAGEVFRASGGGGVWECWEVPSLFLPPLVLTSCTMDRSHGRRHPWFWSNTLTASSKWHYAKHFISTLYFNPPSYSAT